MKNLSELYHSNKNHKWYDYPVEGAVHERYRVNGPKPFKVFHADGTFSYAYGFGSYQFTFSLDELKAVRARYTAEQAQISEHKALVRMLDALDTETLRKIVDQFCLTA